MLNMRKSVKIKNDKCRSEIFDQWTPLVWDKYINSLYSISNTKQVWQYTAGCRFPGMCVGACCVGCVNV